MKLLVCGGRAYDDKVHVFKTLDFLHKGRPITILMHGGARGADSLANDWAEKRRVTTHVYRADWDLWGLSAGRRRNQQMLRQSPDMILAFTGGRGTEHMIMIARRAGVPVIQE